MSETKSKGSLVERDKTHMNEQHLKYVLLSFNTMEKRDAQLSDTDL